MKRGADDVPWEELRLPMSTMLFGQACSGEEIQEFHTCSSCALGLQMQDARPRMVQCKLLKALRLLRCPGAEPHCSHSAEGEAGQAEALGLAERRGLDGLLLGNGRVVLLAPESLVLVDDDKREGLTQQLITDMFTKMSLKCS
ncbi:unnamed protein product [Effrenium voratum]|nr:unnamed protein product [Effrenium voratum]